MTAGLGLLRLAPDTFWKMTPRELERALAPLRGPVSGPPGRADLDRLMRRFPDRLSA